MSVAFRREGDDEHLEPKFEIPILPGPNLVTARGKRLIDSRVAELEAHVTGPGDEASITAAKRDLRYWQTRQVTVELAPLPTGETVGFGTTVTFKLGGKQRTLSIVGDDEAAPAAGLISFSAPLSRALWGAEPGELVAFGGQEDSIEVLSIEVSAAE
jgi:transcription elongation GreA/GreB family factor